jgi:type II secretory ATPase GspE/PulE/Tfp pilus assembly ATPase PilB-like protein
MPESIEKHVAFWETLAALVKKGTPLLKALEQTGAKLRGTAFEETARVLTDDLRSGRDLSEAMEKRTSLFSLAVRAMVHAGEAAGQLDRIVERIVEGLKDGSFPVPGTGRREGAPGAEPDEPPTAETARVFRAFGRLLNSGVNVMKALQIVSDETANTRLGEAMRAVRSAIADGYDMSSVMEKFSDVFAERVTSAVRWGERKGELEAVTMQIAEALDVGDVSGLPCETARASRSEAADLVKAEDTPPVVKLINEILLDAIKGRGASDIHIEPTEDGRGRVRLRVEGVMRPPEPLPERRYQGAVSRVKIMAGLDVAERRRPQDGKIQLNIKGERIDLRVNVLPTVNGESVVMRVLRHGAAARDLGEIGLAEDQLAKVRALCHRDQGVVIVTGPTGSGKSTLLYSMVREIDRETQCVVSVEDPVEYRIEGVEQVQVSHRAGLTFPHALRAVLRHDPEVVLIGEVRDLETAEIGFRAALAGHLVLTMLHTPTATETVRRLLDLGLEPFQINASLAGVTSQRLVRKLCPRCRVETEVSEGAMPKEAVEFIRARGGARVYAPRGCDDCRDGYRGRTAIYEILVPDDEFRRIVTASPDAAGLRGAAVASGMKTIFESGLEKAVEGVTSVEEVCRVAWGTR